MIEGLKPYGKYKDSGQLWLGMVPEHWQLMPNRAIFDEVKDRNHPKEEMLSVTITRGIVRQKALLAGSSKKDSSNLNKDAYKLVQPQDIAYNKMRAWQGALGTSSMRGIISPAYVVMRPRSQAISLFYHHLYRTPLFSKEAERWSYGITSDMWSLRPEHFKVIGSILPPMGEQAAIVRFLDHANRKIDGFIRAKRKLIELLNEQKQAIIHHAVTRGLNPDVALKPSGIAELGDVPADWTIRKIGTLGGFYKGRGIARADITETGVPAITYGDIYTRYDIETKTLCKFTSQEIAINAREIVSGDLLFTASGETIEDIGKTILYSGSVKAYAGGDIVILRQSEGDSLFLSYVLNSVFGVHQKSAFGRGDIIVHISASKLKQIVVPFPSKKQQIAIAKFLDQAVLKSNNASDRAKLEISLMQEYRTRLTSDIVTGKLDVRDAVATLPEEIVPEVTDEPIDLGEEVDFTDEEIDA
jgi:type I restriction enzyme S subunit